MSHPFDADFDREPLSPMGELWRPKTPLAIEPFIQKAMSDVVAAVRSASLVVIENTQINKSVWSPISIPTSFEGPHPDATFFRDSILVHLLHSDGRRNNTAYSKSKSLHAAGKILLPKLKEDLSSFPTDLLFSTGVTNYLEVLEQEIGIYPPSLRIDPLNQIQGRLNLALENPSSRWNEPMDELSRLKMVLIDFERKVAMSCEKLSFPWREHPNATVLAYQGDDWLYEDEKHPERVLHFRDPSLTLPIRNEAPLYRQFIVSNSERSDRGFRFYRPLEARMPYAY